jgi:predicted Rossmann fold nucleotide-binding protein DprA/Smf involved in DNA uptake
MVLDILIEPLPRDELIRKSELSAHKINPLLMMMEVKGLLKESGGLVFKNI